MALAVTMVAALASTTAVAPVASAAGVCPDVELIFARGSGQGLRDAQFVRMRDQLDERLGGDIIFSVYELGTTPQNGHEYPAVNVSDLLNGNAIGRKLSGGQANDYGDSVWEGAQEFAAYAYDRSAS